MLAITKGYFKISLFINNQIYKLQLFISIMAKEVKNKDKECKCSSASGLFIPAGLFVGMGIGFLTNNLVAGIFVGLGAGFVLMGVTRAMCRCKK